MSDKKYSLLHFLVKTLFEGDRKRLTFTNNYEDLSKVLRYDLEEFEKTKNGFFKQVSEIQKEVMEADEGIKLLAGEPNDDLELQSFISFRDHFKPFLEEAKNKLETLNSILEKIRNKAAKCNQIYGLPTTFQPGDLLKLQHTFVELVKKHVNDLNRVEQRNKKKAEYEQKMKARKDAAGKSPTIAKNNSHIEPRKPRQTVKPSDIQGDNLTVKNISEHGTAEVSQEESSTKISLARPSPFLQPRPIVRPTAYSSGNMPLVRPQANQTPGARPQPNNRKRVAIGNQYKKKDGNSEKPSEENEGRLTGATKYQRETVNLSSLDLPSAIAHD